MAINKKLIHFKTLEKFNTELANGNILDTSIVFIQDAQKIWTHGTLYDCDAAALREEIIKNEEVVAAALNYLQENKASKTYVDEAVANAGNDDIYVFEPTDFTQDDDGQTIRGTITLEEYEKISNCRILHFNILFSTDTFSITFPNKFYLSEYGVGFTATISDLAALGVSAYSIIFDKDDNTVNWTLIAEDIYTFKTINGEEILGEGDTSSYPIVDASTLIGANGISNGLQLPTNTYCTLSHGSSILAITLQTPSDTTVVNEYLLEITLTGTPTISFPSSIKWVNGETPSFKSGNTYQISIVNNLAVCFEFR